MTHHRDIVPTMDAGRVGTGAGTGTSLQSPTPRDGLPTELPARGTTSEELSLLDLAAAVLKRWRLVTGLPFAVALLGAVVSLLLPPRYEARAAFAPATESRGIDMPSALAGVASQFGINLPSGSGITSPKFYAELVKSRTIRDEVLRARFPDPRTTAGADSATLLDILEVKDGPELIRLELGRKKLDGAIKVAVDNETRIVTFRVRTPYPALSAAVANLLVELVDKFSLESRQAVGQARRHFSEERLRTAQQELQDAENQLRHFLETNREIRASPQLQFRQQQLERQVTSKEEVYTTLRRTYEEARIQESNDMPVMTIIDHAVPPQQRSSPKRTLMVIGAWFLGGIVAIAVALTRGFLERARSYQDDALQEIRERVDEIRRAVRRILPQGR